MASIARRSNGRWRARVVAPDGRQRSRDFPREVDAEHWAAQQVTRMRDGTWVDPLHARRTFGGYAESWIAQQVHHRRSTSEVTISRLDRWLLPTFGPRPLAAITRSDVQAWVGAVSQNLAPSTVAGCYTLLASIFTAAVEDRMLAASPCRKIKLPERLDGGIHIPASEDIGIFLAYARPHIHAFVAVGAGTGLRPSELTGLTVDRVDFLRREITVDRQLVAVHGETPEWGPPKTKASWRTIPVPEEVTDRIAAHLAAHPTDERGLVFRTANGRPWRRQRLSEEWARWEMWATEGAEAEGGVFRPFRRHDLRHFYASMLIREGLSPKVVQARLGHASSAITLDTYGHLWPDDEDRTRAAVARFWGDAFAI